MQTIISKLSSPRIWLRGLVSAFISGGATALTADQGISLANRLGADVQPLNLQAIGIVFLSAGLSGAAMYLKQSPIPPTSSEDAAP